MNIDQYVDMCTKLGMTKIKTVRSEQLLAQKKNIKNKKNKEGNKNMSSKNLKH